MIGTAQLSTLAIIDERELDERSRLLRRLSRWNGWPTVAKTAGFAAITLIYIPLVWLAIMSISESPLSGIPYPLTLDHYGALMDDERWLPPLQL
ncbi:MAG TPA: hypothetical protein VHL31_18290, partial [Geminicoccus sp.]|uniref:hypothetical protein n=1 Tax=Geminicoccus sp. TaxID=2024832 RepID=UPI002E33D967